MPRLRPERLALAIVFVALGVFLSVGTVLPRETAAVFASPDETAVALFARGWTATEGFRLPTAHWGIGDFIGLHPRSMVQRGPWFVPVGFLGMSLLVMPFERLWEGSGAFFTALLVASSVWPLWRFAMRFGRRAALTASVVYLLFPTVLLYVNRGFFPNLPVVALGLWSVWLVGEKEKWQVMLGGLLLGLALVIRPIEGIWLIPWVVWGFVQRRPLKRIFQQRATAAVLLAALVFPLVAYLAAVQTYQSVMPTIGYWLQDVAVESQIGDPIAAPVVMHTASVLPFGFHPRTVQVNIRAFWLEMLWPWILLACAGLVQLWWRDQITWKSPVLWLTVWTGAVLLLFYGQALYLDNIRGNPAIGNSFLRYLLPLTPLIALAIGAWAQAMARDTRRTVFVAATVAALVLYGTWMGLARDEESILATQQELRRYVAIRDEAVLVLEPGAVVISERSDKIFAGLPGVTAVSPLPTGDLLTRLLDEPSVYWFHRGLTSEEVLATVGVPVRFEEVAAFGNEFLYRVGP